MSNGAEIKKLLRELLGENPNLPITATVVSVEGQTCTIKLLGDLVLSDIRLKATISEGTDGFLITPKVNSEVIVMSQTGKLSGLMVIKIDEVDKIEYKVSDFEFVVDASTKKVTVKNEQANLSSLVSQLVDTIAGIQIINSDTTTGTVQPQIQTALNDIKAKFKLILNE